MLGATRAKARGVTSIHLVSGAWLGSVFFPKSFMLDISLTERRL